MLKNGMIKVTFGSICSDKIPARITRAPRILKRENPYAASDPRPMLIAAVETAIIYVLARKRICFGSANRRSKAEKVISRGNQTGGLASVSVIGRMAANTIQMIGNSTTTRQRTTVTSRASCQRRSRWLNCSCCVAIGRLPLRNQPQVDDGSHAQEDQHQHTDRRSVTEIDIAKA